MRKSLFNNEFLVLLGPIISRLFTCSNEEKNKIKKQRVLALVLSLWKYPFTLFRQADDQVWNELRLIGREEVGSAAERTDETSGMGESCFSR
jgi:hypothetical protein